MDTAPQNDAFSAIAHPVRRRILDLLAVRDRPVNEIAQHFEMSRPAVSQHLRALLDAGLVAERRYGRERRYHLIAEGLGPVAQWLAHYERFWDQRLDALRQRLSSEQPHDKPSANGAQGKQNDSSSPYMEHDQ